MSAEPHRIRLKGPWQYEWLSTSQSADSSGTVRMPCRWESVFGERAGTVRFRRRFQRPTNLDANEHVSIVFDGVGGAGQVAVNENALGAITDAQQTARFEVTSLLQPTNELVVELSFDPRQAGDQPGGLWGPVVIEIHTE